MWKVVIGSILLLIALGSGIYWLTSRKRLANNVPLGVAVAAGVLSAISFAFASLTTIPANYGGVEVLFGRPVRVLYEGLHLKNPLSEVAKIPGLQLESTYAEAEHDDAVEAVTADNAVVDVDATVLWYLDLLGDSPKQIYREYRTASEVERRLLRPVSRDVIRDCVADVPFEEARTTHRQQIADCAQEGILEKVSASGVIIRAVQIRNMSARSSQLQDSIDRKLAAEQAAREAEFRRSQASVDADTARIKAEGEANAEVARANGTAEANHVVNESLTDLLLEYRKYEFLSSAGNTTWVIGTGASPDLMIPMG